MIDIMDVKDYWKTRSEKQGALTVGFDGRNSSIQDAEYNQRYDFIIPNIDTKLYTLDYGCGVGKYSDKFKKYIGMDITELLINIAKNTYPQKEYILLDKIGVNIKLDVEQFFTATVLQHNSDESVSIILKSLYDNCKDLKSIVLYENTSNMPNKSHIKFRTVYDYMKMVSEYFDIKNFNVFKHIIHNEEHSLIKLYL